jgi:hypothetical protein
VGFSTALNVANRVTIGCQKHCFDVALFNFDAAVETRRWEYGQLATG